MEERIGDLIINGKSSSAGGNYNDVIINGEGKIYGDLDCVYWNVNGKCTVNGDVKSDSVKVYGDSLIKGNLRAEKAKIYGTADIVGNMSVDKAETYGSISVDGDCNAEIFTVEGGLTIDGLLNADIVKINLYWPCKVYEIGGSEITVKKSGKLSFLGLKNMVMPGGQNELTADIIEGDDVYLENTKAKVVRGTNVTIGSGCKIEMVEYKNSFKQDEKSEIGTNKKI